MKCKWYKCDNEAKGKALYCSGACRVKQSRSVTGPMASSVTESPSSVTSSPDSVTVDGKCYSRLAIRCPEFATRPCPVAATDKPVPHNRGRCERLDGTVYQFDINGHVFECRHVFYDSTGMQHQSVYETLADVQETVLA